MSIVQITLLLFLIFALSRVMLRFRDRQIKPVEFIFWGLLFTTAIVLVIFPNETSRFSQLVGIGRGVDLIIYTSLVVLFYIAFRTYIQLEDMRHEVTVLIRQLALEKETKKHANSLSRRIVSKRRRK